jgi:hypothetical protein
MRPRLLVVVLLLAAGFIACSDGYEPPAPSPTTVSPLLGPPKSLQVTGNLSFSFIGESRQLTASATFGGGAVRNVTSQAQWSSSNPAVATVTAGLVKVVSFGDTQITATYRGLTSEKAAVTAKANAVLTSISVSGPAEIAPGTSGQFTATGRYDDGSSKDISSTATWRSDDSTILRSAGSGRFDALKGGETPVRASSSNRGASTNVLVLPAGTFKLSGTVRDPGGTVDGVDVEVVSGNTSSLKTTSRFDGKYALYGVAGNVRVRASGPGYATEEVDVTVGGHTVRDFSLRTSGPIADISGAWKLKVSTSSACSSSWPEAMRQRELAATITQSGTRFSLRFNSPTVVSTYPVEGKIAGSAFSMTLHLDYYYYYYYYGFSGLLERFNQTEWLRLAGTFRSPDASSSVIAGNLEGTFSYFVTTASARTPSGSPRTCAADAPFEFRR